jgi:H+/gluconate symporter-like permease
VSLALPPCSASSYEDAFLATGLLVRNLAEVSEATGPSAEVLTAALWGFVIAATLACMGFMFRAFWEAKEVIDRRQDKEKEKELEQEEKKRKLKEMFDRL